MVVDMAEAVVAEGEAEASMVEVDTLVAIVAGTPEDSAAGILAVDTVLLLHLEDILVGTIVVTPEDTEGGYHGGYRGGYYGRGFYPYWGFGLGWGLWGWPLLGWAYAGWPYYSYGGYPYLGWPYYSSAYHSDVITTPPVYNEPEQQQANYWYYCTNPQGYYPYIRNCPGGWLTVVPNGTPPNQ